MLEKNQKKEDAKHFRGEWSCARPQGSITPNKKIASRARQKQLNRKEQNNA